MSYWRDYYAVLMGRILVGGFFLWTGILNVINLPEVSATLTTSGFPAPIASAIGVASIEVLVGLALIVGWQVRVVAIVGAIYLLGAALALHGTLATSEDTTRLLDSVAIAGGLLYMSTYEGVPVRGKK